MSNSTASISTTLLYQPYYHRPGHFKSLFHIYFEYFNNNLSETYGVVGVQKQEDALQEEQIFTFSNPFQNTTLQIVSNLRGLRAVSKLLEKTPSIRNIHFLDIEIVLLALYVLFHRRQYRKRRIVITQHSVNHYTGKTGIIGKLYQFVARRAYRYLNEHLDLRVLTNGRFIADSLIQDGFVKEENIIVSSWGSEGAAIPVTQRDKEKHTFLFIGIIRKDKNLEYLLESFKEIGSDFKLIIAGYPEDYSKQEIHNLTQSSRIPGNKLELHLKYLSENEMQRLYLKSQFIILPYSPENKSNSGPLITGLQYECIPIVSNYGERGHFVNRYEMGLSFSFDGKELSQIIRKVLNNHELIERYRSNIREQKETFTWPNLIESAVERGAYR